MKKTNILITILIVFFILYVIYVFLTTFTVMKEVSYRSKNFIHRTFYDYSYSSGLEELIFLEFEDVSDYDISFKIITCIPVIGFSKGVILYKYEFESYKDGKLVCGAWDKWWYGKSNKIYIKRNGFKWNMVNIIEQP